MCVFWELIQGVGSSNMNSISATQRDLQLGVNRSCEGSVHWITSHMNYNHEDAIPMQFWNSIRRKDASAAAPYSSVTINTKGLIPTMKTFWITFCKDALLEWYYQQPAPHFQHVTVVGLPSMFRVSRYIYRFSRPLQEVFHAPKRGDCRMAEAARSRDNQE